LLWPTGWNRRRCKPPEPHFAVIFLATALKRRSPPPKLLKTFAFQIADIVRFSIAADKYTAAQTFSEGLAAVCISPEYWTEKPKQWCYIDRTGKRSIDQAFEYAGSFSEGLAAVTHNGYMGAIDKTGQFIIPAIYDSVGSCSCGIVVAGQGSLGLDWLPQKNNKTEKLLYFDRSGTLLFTRNIKRYRLKFLSTDLSGFRFSIPFLPSLNELGSGPYRALGLERGYLNNHGFVNNLALMQSGSKYGYMDRSGKQVIPAIYDRASPFSDGMAIVYKDSDGGLFAYIDESGHQVTTFKFRDVTPFSEGLAAVSEGERGPWGFIDKTGKYAIRPTFEYAASFKEGKARVGLCPHPI